ncbi:hypothetical protein B484DRAFT_452579 [Ochromonadaceae sp. CCMP2298]|nr:hypothetical protein B484DRAFT_452579 [Ochromonadaceae sp. CCMP2298]
MTTDTYSLLHCSTAHCHTRFSREMMTALDDLGVNDFKDLQMMLEDADMCAEVAKKVRRAPHIYYNNRTHSFRHSHNPLPGQADGDEAPAEAGKGAGEWWTGARGECECWGEWWGDGGHLSRAGGASSGGRPTRPVRLLFVLSPGLFADC